MGNQMPSVQPVEGCNFQFMLNALHCMSVTAFTEQSVTAEASQYKARERVKLFAISTKLKFWSMMAEQKHADAAAPSCNAGKTAAACIESGSNLGHHNNPQSHQHGPPIAWALFYEQQKDRQGANIAGAQGASQRQLHVLSRVT